MGGLADTRRCPPAENQPQRVREDSRTGCVPLTGTNSGSSDMVRVVFMAKIENRSRTNSAAFFG
jgi:hypothetical protein